MTPYSLLAKPPIQKQSPPIAQEVDNSNGQVASQRPWDIQRFLKMDNPQEAAKALREHANKKGIKLSSHERKPKYKKPRGRAKQTPDNLIRLFNGRQFIPTEGLDDALSVRVQKTKKESRDKKKIVCILQIQDDMTMEEVIELLEFNVKIYEPIGRKTFIARLPASAIDSLSNKTYVRSIKEYKPEYKYKAFGFSADKVMVFIETFDGDKPEYREYLQANDCIVLGFVGNSKTYCAVLNPSVLLTITEEWWVKAVYECPREADLSMQGQVTVNFEADDSRELVLAYESNSGLTGNGVLIGVREAKGIYYQHPSLFGHFHPDSELTDEPAAYHAGHVAAIIAGREDSISGPWGNGTIKGVAPASDILFRVADWWGTAYLFDFQSFYNNDTQISNHSYGFQEFGGGTDYSYNTHTNNFDKYCDNDDMVIIVAAGNDGSSGISNPATGKNVIAVGAINPATDDDTGFTTEMIGKRAYYSSKGPTHNGLRLKPDLVAPGGNNLNGFKYGVVSASSDPWDLTTEGYGTGAIDNNYQEPEWETDDFYIRLCGTSQAAPHVSGICAQMKQWKSDFHSELLKATLINTTIPIKENSDNALGGYANTSVGYGLANAFSATGAYFEGESERLLFGEDWVTEDDLYDNWSIMVPQGTKKLIVTLAYNDQEDAFYDFNIKDNLDLILISPQGIIDEAYNHLPTDGESPLEKMVIEDPTPGEWTVKVDFFNSYGFGNPLIYAEQRYGIVAHAILKTPSLDISVPTLTINVTQGGNFMIQPTITNVGGYIAAGVTAKIYQVFGDGFGGDIDTTRYVGNLMCQGDFVTPDINLVAPTSPGSYQLTIEADGINKEFDNPEEYPKTIQVTVNVSSDLPPDIPTGLTVSAGSGCGDVVFSWDPSEGATSYKIYYDENLPNPPFTPSQDGDSPSGSDIGDVTQVSITGLTSNQTYYFAVEAFNANGGSGYSGQASSLTGNNCAPVDNEPPEPNPLTWYTEPYQFLHQFGESSIAMSATVATDQTPPVSYYFDFVSSPTGGSGGADWGWRLSSGYYATDLETNHQYGYRVKAKDSLGHETDYSPESYEYTSVETPSGITVGIVTTYSISVKASGTFSGLDRGISGLLIENTAIGTNSEWNSNNDFWVSNSLSPNTQYSFRLKARNGDGDETDYSPTYIIRTKANQPGLNDFSNISDTYVRANWDANGNPAWTSYYCENATNDSNSGWITNTYWTDRSVMGGLTYCYRVKARNDSGVETNWADLGCVKTPNAKIRGTVTDVADGLPISDAEVMAWDSEQSLYKYGQTDTNGVYELTGLFIGNYRVSIDIGNYSREYYDNVYNHTNATAIEIGEDEVVNNIDFELIIGGSISGTILDSNSLPISSLTVYAMEYGSSEWYGGAFTDVNGHYEITKLPPGSYRVNTTTFDGVYAQEYYNNVFSWKQATPVSVASGIETSNINFQLLLGASIIGSVKYQSGLPATGIDTICSFVDGSGSGSTTDSNGFYEFKGLGVGEVYKIVAYPNDTNYMINRIFVEVLEPKSYYPPEIILETGALTVSGTVTDDSNGQPLPNIRVDCWHNDLEIWAEVFTDVNGLYILTNLPPGNIEIGAKPDTYYAYIGSKFYLDADVYNLDFALPMGAIISGKVVDSNTAEPLSMIEVTYWNGQYAAWQTTFTDIDGGFMLRHLPPGIAEVLAQPDISHGYCWNSPWPNSWVLLNEGESVYNKYIAVQKGALLSGYFEDASGNPLISLNYDFSGKNSGGWEKTGVNGKFEIRLPIGTYGINVDRDKHSDLTSLIGEVTITDVDQSIEMGDIVAYSEATGGYIAGSLSNPGGSSYNGIFFIGVFETEAIVNSDTIYFISPITETVLFESGDFYIDSIPLGSQYDIISGIYTVQNEIFSLTVRDSVLNVSPGTSGINLNYNSPGSTVTGQLTNPNSVAIIGAYILLTQTDGTFAGVTISDSDGGYTFNNVAAGNYKVTIAHSKYVSEYTTIQVEEGIPKIADTIIAQTMNEKEGADLNGNGVVDLFDLVEFSSEWLQSGSTKSNFNEDFNVNFYDFVRIAESWLWEAMWHNE